MDKVELDALLMTATASHMTVAGSFEAITQQDNGTGFTFEPLTKEEFEQVIDRLDEVSYIGGEDDVIVDRLKDTVVGNGGEYRQVDVSDCEGYEPTGIMLAAYVNRGEMRYWSVSCNG